MKYAAGIDVGSTQTKAVLVDTGYAVIGRALIDTGANVRLAGQRALDAILGETSVARDEIGFVVGTGYGRYKIEAGDAQVTEICCHARGAARMYPATRTVLDMGGQDTKAIRVSAAGEIVDFCMNDKCAAGTGRFLGAASAALEIPLDELGPTALRAERPVPITTTCTVFAESEVLSWLARGKTIEDILLGVHQSIVSRAMGLARRVGIERELTFTGGVSRNIGMVQALNDALGFAANVSEDSHYMGAIGAALFALDRCRAGALAPAESGL